MKANVKDLQNFMKEKQYSWDTISSYLKKLKREKIEIINFSEMLNDIELEEIFFLAKVFDDDPYYKKVLRKLSVGYVLGKDNYFLNLAKEKQLNEFHKILNLTMKHINEKEFIYDDYKKIKLEIAKTSLSKINEKKVSDAEKERLKGLMDIVMSATCYSPAGSCICTTKSIQSYLKSNNKSLLKNEEERFIKLFNYITTQNNVDIA